MICSKIPYAVEQGIFLSRTGNWNCRTGKPFAVNQGIKNPGPRGLIEEFFALSGFRSRTPQNFGATAQQGRASGAGGDHSAGKSARRATPMPCGSRPSMAALTRSGARKASEIVHIHLADAAPLSLGDAAVSAAISSSSQRRPRAIDATKVARFSERIGRACCGDIPSGTRIARRRLDIVFCQAT